MPVYAATIVELFESSGALEISVFHAFVEGNGTKPLRLPILPKLKPLQTGPPDVEVTATVVDDTLLESCVEVAVMVAVCAVPGGVKVTVVPEATPVLLLSVPAPDGLMERLTVSEKAPLPVTVGVQVAVCAVVMLLGVQTSVTPVMVGPTLATPIDAELDCEVSCRDVAVQVPFPTLAGVKTPL